MALSPTESPAAASRNGVDIQMFRHGFGDCFLVSIYGGQERPFTMLVDCGLLKGTRDEAKRLAEVADCIRDQVPEGYIDVLVLSHPHYDHVSGFLPNRSAGKIFRSLNFGQLWLPWSENPDDINAAAAKKQHLLRVLALKASVDLQPDRKHPLQSMLDFYGTTGSWDRLTMQVESELAIQTVRETLVAGEDHRYWRAGDTTTLPGTGGARVYFLGPQDEFGSAGTRPTFPAARIGHRCGVSQEQGELIAAIARKVDAEKMPKLLERFGIQPIETNEMHELSMPFERHWRVPLTVDKQLPANASPNAGRPQTPDELLREFVLADEPLEAKGKRRGISPLPPTAPLDLALRLDAETNKSSLVMAIELPRSGKVLLFPGDAPASDWKVWQKLTWPNNSVDASQPATGKQLLANAVFYKVSQRGSATGTSNAHGLSLLNPDLIAMLPIDESLARRRGWNLPFPALLDALRAKTKNRVIRTADKPRGIVIDSQPTKLLGPRFIQVTIADNPPLS